MVVRYASKYADIWVDALSTVGGKLPESSPCVVDMLYGLLERRQKDLPRRAGACGGRGGVSIYDIPIQLSAEIAVEVCEIIFPLLEGYSVRTRVKRSAGRGLLPKPRYRSSYRQNLLT